MRRYLKISIILYLFISLIIFFICYQVIFAQQKTITLGVFAGSAWKVPNPTVYRLYDSLIADFRAQHPEYLVSYKSGIQIQDYSEKISKAILKGEEPDLFFILPEDFTTFASIGILEDLNKYIKDGSIDTSQFYENALAAGKYNNSQFALPFEIVPSLMFVNISLLNSLKLPLPEPTWDWNQLMYYVQAATKDVNGNGVIDIFGINGWTWLDAAYSNNQMLFNSDGPTVLLNNEGVIEAVDFYLRLKNLFKNLITPDFDSGKVLFSPFQYSSYRAYKYYPYSIQRFGDFKWQAINMPKGPRGKNASELKVLLIGISKRSRNKKGVIELLAHLTTNQESAYRILEYSQGLPALKNIITTKRAGDILAHHITASETYIDTDLLNSLIIDSVIVPRFKKHTAALDLATRTINSEQVQSISSLKNFLSRLEHTLESFIKD